MSPQMGEAVCRLLQERRQLLTLVELCNGQRLEVFNIVWGRDIAADYDHITTNISPAPKAEHTIDFFLTLDVRRVFDGLTGKVLLEDTN